MSFFVRRKDSPQGWIHRRAFDLLNSDDTYSIHFRLVRIKLDDGNYECLVTNLPRDRFSMKS